MENYELQLEIINSNKKYLTAEHFGFKIRASEKYCAKKQRWFMEFDDKNVYFRSYLGRYLSTDKEGNVLGSSTTKGSDEQFAIKFCPENSGRWAIQNQQTTYFLGVNEDNLQCNAKEPSVTEWWSANFNLQINLLHVKTKMFVNLKQTGLKCDMTIPWGSDCLVTLEWKGNEKEAFYGMRLANNHYLDQNGDLKEQFSPSCLLRIEFKIGKNGGFAFKYKDGKYLTRLSNGIIQSRKGTISEDELFIFQESSIQGVLLAKNRKYVTLFQG